MIIFLYLSDGIFVSLAVTDDIEKTTFPTLGGHHAQQP